MIYGSTEKQCHKKYRKHLSFNKRSEDIVREGINKIADVGDIIVVRKDIRVQIRLYRGIYRRRVDVVQYRGNGCS